MLAQNFPNLGQELDNFTKLTEYCIISVHKELYQDKLIMKLAKINNNERILKATGVWLTYESVSFPHIFQSIFFTHHSLFLSKVSQAPPYIVGQPHLGSAFLEGSHHASSTGITPKGVLNQEDGSSLSINISVTTGGCIQLAQGILWSTWF